MHCLNCKRAKRKEMIIYKISKVHLTRKCKKDARMRKNLYFLVFQVSNVSSVDLITSESFGLPKNGASKACLDWQFMVGTGNYCPTFAVFGWFFCVLACRCCHKFLAFSWHNFPYTANRLSWGSSLSWVGRENLGILQSSLLLSLTQRKATNNAVVTDFFPPLLLPPPVD